MPSVPGSSLALELLLGWWFARLPRPWWALGYLIALGLVIAFAVANYFPVVSVTPPFSWMLLGQKRYVTMGFITAMVLTTPLSRIPRKQDRRAVALLTVMIVGIMSIRPFIAPLCHRDELSHLKTKIDKNGICLQGTGYTCGPASAVTALRKLGFPAEEGRLAILSRTPVRTRRAHRTTFSPRRCNRNTARTGWSRNTGSSKTLAELKEQAGLTLAVIKFGLFVGHYVTVLDVTDSQVVVGDPINGLQNLTYEEFLQEWCCEGVVLKTPSIESELDNLRRLPGLRKSLRQSHASGSQRMNAAVTATENGASMRSMGR